MKNFITKSLLFILLLFIVFQIAYPHLFDLSDVYSQRVNYDIFKDNVSCIETVLDKISEDINTNNYNNYIIILGDSVAYSSPGNDTESIGYYMNEIIKNNNDYDKVYNLAIPSMQMGDIYVLLNMIHSHDISTNNLIVNVIYPGFINCVPYNTPVFWMKDYLREIDKHTYDKVYSEFYPNIDESAKDYTLSSITHYLKTNVTILKYKDYFKHKIESAFISKIPKASQAWTEKPFLYDLIKTNDYEYIYTDKLFAFNESTPQIYFLEKIIDMQKGKNTLFFLASMNEKLLGDSVHAKGYVTNMNNIDAYFNEKADIKYINYNKKIDFNLFSDHIHLLPEGYKFLASDLYQKISE
ncbi:hypothetical protein PV797_03550 [Clostridiaceae bacterium M8S5]|nr:hypothetical protein PV797_03550 [Clostridiaceae bacterium M8S5]